VVSWFARSLSGRQRFVLFAPHVIRQSLCVTALPRDDLRPGVGVRIWGGDCLNGSGFPAGQSRPDGAGLPPFLPVFRPPGLLHPCLEPRSDGPLCLPLQPLQPPMHQRVDLGYHLVEGEVVQVHGLRRASGGTGSAHMPLPVLLSPSAKPHISGVIARCTCWASATPQQPECARTPEKANASIHFPHRSSSAAGASGVTDSP
jgi:hypothetical protein